MQSGDNKFVDFKTGGRQISALSVLSEPAGAADHRRAVSGAAKKAVVIVEYGDFECRACGAAFRVLKEIERLAPNPLLYVFRHFPLETIHPQALKAAEAAEAAARQGKFWEMHDSLLENQENLDDASLVKRAADFDLNVVRFLRDVADGVCVAKIRGDLKSGAESGVCGAPTFFINNRVYAGAIQAEAMLAAIGAA